jgi:hypothetical protein
MHAAFNYGTGVPSLENALHLNLHVSRKSCTSSGSLLVPVIQAWLG